MSNGARGAKYVFWSMTALKYTVTIVYSASTQKKENEKSSKLGNYSCCSEVIKIQRSRRQIVPVWNYCASIYLQTVPLL
jgi:hypothetical protein